MLNRPTTLLPHRPSFDRRRRGSKHTNYSVGMLVTVNHKGWPNWGSFVGQRCFRLSDCMVFFFCREKIYVYPVQTQHKQLQQHMNTSAKINIPPSVRLMWSENHRPASYASVSLRCVLKTFHAFSLHRSRHWAAQTQPHVKNGPDSPERGDWSRFNPSAVLQARRRSITLRDQNAEFTHSPFREWKKKNVQRPSAGKFCTPPSSLVLRTMCFVFGSQIMHSPVGPVHCS